MADQWLSDHIRDLADQSLNREVVTHSAFLTPAEQGQATAWLRKNSRNHVFHGGYPGAERQVCFLLPDGYGKSSRSSQSHVMSDNESDDKEQAGILLQKDLQSALCCLALSWTKRDPAPGHRDCLGSLLALGIRRDQIGDIILQPGTAMVLCLAGIAPLITSQLHQVGRTPVSVSVMMLADIPRERAATTIMRISAASLRLDRIAASGFNLARTDMADHIRNGLVQVNWQTELRPDRILALGSVISLRGHGRIRLVSETGKSRKDRHILLVERW